MGGLAKVDPIYRFVKVEGDGVTTPMVEELERQFEDLKRRAVELRSFL